MHEVMSNSTGFAATCYKNDCSGKLEISTDSAKNNHVNAWKEWIPRRWDLGTLEEVSITEHCPLQGESPTASACC